MLILKRYYKIFIFNIVFFVALSLIVSFIQKSQKIFVWEARLIIDENIRKSSDENLMNYLYPTKENEYPYQKIIDYIISVHTIKRFIISKNYNFYVEEKEPKNMKIKKIEIYKQFPYSEYKFKTNEKNENYYIISNINGYVKIKFLDYDNAVRKFMSKLNLKVTNSSEFIRAKNLPQFSPNMIYISFSSKDEYEGEIFKEFINFLFEDNLNQKKETYNKLKNLIKNQIDYYNKEIENIDEKIKNIKLEITNNPNVITDIIVQEYLTQMEIKNLINYLNDGKNYILTTDSVINNYLRKISNIEDSLKILSLKYGNESFEYNYTKLVLDSLKANIKNIIQKRLNYLNEKLKMLRNQTEQFKEISDYAIELENELSKLNTQKQSILEILSLLNKKLKEIEMEEASMKTDFKLFQISENPNIISKLNSLNRNLIISILFSLFFSVMYILLSEYFKNTIRNLEEAQIKLNTQNIFEIPYVSDIQDIPLNIYFSGNYHKILTGLYSIESFRIMVLKTILDKKHNLIGITSSIQGDGKTFISLNISAILSMMKSKVVILDTDLRKKSLSFEFRLDNELGISNILEINDYRNLIYNLNENLFLVPAGNEFIDPLGIFISDKFKQFLNYLKANFDYIIIDLPPILGISETNVIIDYLNSIIFIIKAEKTPINQIQQALSLINKEKILAYVLNGATSESSYYEYYYYYKSYKK